MGAGGRGCISVLAWAVNSVQKVESADVGAGSNGQEMEETWPTEGAVNGI
jgi:hypothetical protein